MYGLSYLIGVSCGICSDVQLSENCWAPKCSPPEHLALGFLWSALCESLLIHRPAAVLPLLCEYCPQTAGESLQCCVSCLTARGRQGVSLQFPLTSPSAPPPRPVSAGVSLPTPHPFSSCPSFLFPFPFLSFLFFVCRTENITVTLRPEHRCNINGSLSLYFLSCLVNVLYFS